MTTDDTPPSVLLIGKSQAVLDATVASLRDLGYKAAATNDFSDVTGRFDRREIDLVVLGGKVPPERKAELKEEISVMNPRAIFVQGLAGIPGLLVHQVRGALAIDDENPARAPTYTPEDRLIRFSLTGTTDVEVTVWWQTSFVPPDPKSDSQLLLDDQLARGEHTVPVPDHIPSKAAFGTVSTDSAIYAFSIATEQ